MSNKVIEPRNIQMGKVHVLVKTEDNIICLQYGKEQMTPRGRRARHATKGNKVNVGDPKGSSKEVSDNEHKSEKPEKAFRESEGS